MKKTVLLSIHPEYAEAMFDGQKQFEFRRIVFKQPVDKIVVYATKPVGQVIGTFDIEEILSDTPDALWEKTKHAAGITREKFDAYFGKRNTAHAIKVAVAERFATPRLLSQYVASNTAPQSFCYVEAP